MNVVNFNKRLLIWDDSLCGYNKRSETFKAMSWNFYGLSIHQKTNIQECLNIALLLKTVMNAKQEEAKKKKIRCRLVVVSENDCTQSVQGKEKERKFVFLSLQFPQCESFSRQWWSNVPELASCRSRKWQWQMAQRERESENITIVCTSPRGSSSLMFTSFSAGSRASVSLCKSTLPLSLSLSLSFPFSRLRRLHFWCRLRTISMSSGSFLEQQTAATVPAVSFRCPKVRSNACFSCSLSLFLFLLCGWVMVSSATQRAAGIKDRRERVDKQRGQVSPTLTLAETQASTVRQCN